MTKKIQLLSTSVILAILVMAGCSKKKDDLKPGPQVKIDSVPGSFKNQAFYGIGSQISLSYKVTTSENLGRVNTTETVVPSTITPSNQSVDKTSDFTTATSYNTTYTTSIPSGATNVTIKVTATDAKNQSGTASFIARNTIKDQVIGGANKSFYSSVNSNTSPYKDADFEANKSKIDITFGYFGIGGAAPQSVLVSSDQRGQISGVTVGKGGLQTFFKESTLTSAQFGTATAADISKITASSTQYVAVAKDKVYEFVSPTLGTKGLINVTSFNIAGDPTASTITFDLKVIQ